MTVISTETMPSVAQSFLRSQFFPCPCLGAAGTHRQSGGRGLPRGGLSALRGQAAQRDLPTQAARPGASVERGRSPVQLLLRGVPAPGDAGLGAVLRAPVPRGPRVRDARGTGLGAQGAARGGRAPVGGPVIDAEALAGMVAEDDRGHAAVAHPGRGAGGAAGEGAAALAAATRSGAAASLAAVELPDVAQALDRTARAAWRAGAVRRKCFGGSPDASGNTPPGADRCASRSPLSSAGTTRRVRRRTIRLGR